MKKILPLFALSVVSASCLPTLAHAQMSREAGRHLNREAAAVEQSAESVPTTIESADPAVSPAPAETDPSAPVIREQPFVVEPVVPPPEVVDPVPTESVVDLAALQAEVDRDANSYRNDNYTFEMTDKGFLRRLALADGTVLVDSAGAVNLQGSYVTPQGRRVWFYAGGVGNSSYTASTMKSVKDGAVVFDVNVNHPRFGTTSTYICRAHEIEVHVIFTPVKMEDTRGPIFGIYALQMWPACLKQDSGPAYTDGQLVYATKSGALEIVYNGESWPVDSSAVGRGVRVGDTGLAFNFEGSAESKDNTLIYTIKLP